MDRSGTYISGEYNNKRFLTEQRVQKEVRSRILSYRKNVEVKLQGGHNITFSNDRCHPFLKNIYGSEFY